MSVATFSEVDYRHMARALQLARRGWYSSQPNPRVGCVIVNHNRIVGEGFHQRAGTPHAEIHALEMAGENARNATAYVTLEPCHHQGKTPPCDDALIAAGIARVVYAISDPNPQVGGRGEAKLRANDIQVSSGLMAEQAREINRGFLMRHEQGRPRVTIKLAMTLDAKFGLKSGESKWITGPEARQDVQRLRAQSCAIVTGSGTVRADNPRLTVRDKALQTFGRQPRIVILDSNLTLTSDYAVFQSGAQCILMHCKGSSNANVNATTHKISATSGKLDLNQVMAHLVALECNEVMVEAGPSLSSAFIAAGLWDELVVYMAPKIIGTSGKEGFLLPLIDELSDATAIKFGECRYVGADLRIVLTPA